MPFGLMVKKSRTRKGMSQADLGELADVSESRIVQIESGWIPTPELADRLARICEMDPTAAVMWALRAKSDEERTHDRLHLERAHDYPPEVLEEAADAESRMQISGITSLRRVRDVPQRPAQCGAPRWGYPRSGARSLLRGVLGAQMARSAE